jgi:hypothetical protein
MKILEPAGFLAVAGARIAFGSDWPVDQLDEWFALKVGVTRTNSPEAPPEYRGRLGDDPGLPREAVLRAATIDAAYELHEDGATGSLEVGKFADLIVLDRNPLEVPAEEIAKTQVLQTVIGGSVLYQASAAPHYGSLDLPQSNTIGSRDGGSAEDAACTALPVPDRAPSQVWRGCGMRAGSMGFIRPRP